MAKFIQLIAVALFLSVTASTQEEQISSGNKIDPLPRDLEIELSALPPHLREDATVYVLNPEKGFEVARQGTNGFHAFVARLGDDTFRRSWTLKEYRDDILYPISFDEAGSKACAALPRSMTSGVCRRADEFACPTNSIRPQHASG